MNWQLPLFKTRPPPPTSTSAERGAWAEKLALQHLRKQGLKLVAQNYRCRGGELDLIMRQNGVLAFIEVRYRHSASHGSALESIDGRKQARIMRCAEQYLRQHKEFAQCDSRFDVVVVTDNKGKAELEWLADAFRDGI